MRPIDQQISRYFENLNQRANSIIELHTSDTNTDVTARIEEDLGVEQRALEAVMGKIYRNRIISTLAVVLGGIAAAIYIGIAMQNIFVPLVVVAVAVFVGSRILDLPKLEVIIDQGRQKYFEAIQAGIDAELEPARRSLEAWQQLHPHPAPQPYGVSPAGAEAWVCDWMVHMGAEGSTVTQQSGDGGIDVENDHFIAQVKHYTNSVGVGEIREHIGVSAVDPMRRQPLFFTSGTYPSGALDAAEAVAMPLFIYSVEEGTVVPVNRFAEFVMEAGLNPSWAANHN